VHRLTGRLRRRRAPGLRDDHGAIATVVALMLSSGVLLGMGALVVDVGRLYVEREQLQSGADAASWKIALSCIAGNTCTNAAQAANAVDFAKKNANDNAADAQVCLSGTTCAAWKTNATCPATPSASTGGSSVEVRTSTVTSSGSTIIPPVFAGTLPGISYAGKQTGACARVSWGVPVLTRSLALAMSLCDWGRITGQGTKFAGLPLVGNLLDQAGVYAIAGQPNPTGTIDNAVVGNTPLGVNLTLCTSGWPSLTAPRGYAWLKPTDADGDCYFSPGIGDWVGSFNPLDLTSLQQNSAVANSCSAELKRLRNSGQPVLVPLYDQNFGITQYLATYHIVGFAPFVITGYQSILPGLVSAVSTVTNVLPSVSTLLCGVANCIYGYFTKALVPAARPVFGTGSNYGATMIGRTG
jgi:Flp pilus assembly protein TadG